MAQDALNESKRLQSEEDAKVFSANPDLIARMEREGLEINYAAEDDYLRLIIGVAKPSIAVSRRDPIYCVAMVDPDSYEINAIEAPFFMEMVNKLEIPGNADPVTALWALVIRLVKAGHSSIYIPPREERERTERALQDLVRS